MVGASLLSLPTALKRLFTALTTKIRSREACRRPSTSGALLALPVLPGAESWDVSILSGGFALEASMS